ncbi:MAG: hypothetical protein OEY23_26695, partial [Acidimicrobiia bacterium]|nr:hypothetical protein [Acidimicrobiia bacterium]
MGRVDPGIVEHLAVARRHLGKAVLAGLVAAIAVLAVRGGERRAYEATADVRLALVDPGGTPADEAEFHAETYSRLAKSPSVVAAAARSAGLDLTPAEAARRLDATVLDAPGFVAVTASA